MLFITSSSTRIIASTWIGIKLGLYSHFKPITLSFQNKIAPFIQPVYIFNNQLSISLLIPRNIQLLPSSFSSGFLSILLVVVLIIIIFWWIWVFLFWNNRLDIWIMCLVNWSILVVVVWLMLLINWTI